MSAGTAERVLLARTVLTMDRARPVAQALAVDGGTITAVGEAAEVLAGAPPGCEVVDLGDVTVLPGFVEAHAHPSMGMAFRGAGVVDVRAPVCPTAADALAAVRAAVDAAPDGEPLTVVGWEELVRDLPEPSRELLDALAPRNPLAVLHNSLHSAWANTLAIRAAGLARETPDPEGSWFVRDADGEPTGRAEEIPATVLLAGAPVRVAPQDAPALMRRELDAFAAAGVTTVGELALDPQQRPLFRAVAAAGAPVRVRAYRMSNRPDAGGRAPGDAMFREVGVKLWADGSPWVGSYAASTPYPDNEVTRRLGFAGHRGCCTYTPDQVRELCLTAFAAGEQVAVHAQGDVAIDLVLDAVAAALAEHPVQDHRVRLEHCCLMTPEQYRRAAGLGVTCSLFLSHVRYWGDALLDHLLGERAHGWTAARSALDAGVRISLHNDVPVTPSEPLRNVQVAVTRRTAGSGRVLGEHERITVDEALRTVTLDAAWQLRSEHEVGSLEVGKRADLVVLDADPRTCDPERIGDVAVLGTWLDGVPVVPGVVDRA